MTAQATTWLLMQTKPTAPCCRVHLHQQPDSGWCRRCTWAATAFCCRWAVPAQTQNVLTLANLCGQAGAIVEFSCCNCLRQER